MYDVWGSLSIESCVEMYIEINFHYVTIKIMFLKVDNALNPYTQNKKYFLVEEFDKDSPMLSLTSQWEK